MPILFRVRCANGPKRVPAWIRQRCPEALVLSQLRNIYGPASVGLAAESSGPVEQGRTRESFLGDSTPAMKCVASYSGYWQSHTTDKPQRTTYFRGTLLHWWTEHLFSSPQFPFGTPSTANCIRCGTPLSGRWRQTGPPVPLTSPSPLPCELPCKSIG